MRSCESPHELDAEKLGAPTAHSLDLGQGLDARGRILGEPIDEPLREYHPGVELHVLRRLDAPRPERLAASLHHAGNAGTRIRPPHGELGLRDGEAALDGGEDGIPRPPHDVWRAALDGHDA